MGSFRNLVGAVASLAGALSAIGLAVPAAATPAPYEDGDTPCGQVIVAGRPEVVTAFPLDCPDAMGVARKMAAAWPGGAGPLRFDHWECKRPTSFEIGGAKPWDYGCHSSKGGGTVIFSPNG